MLPPSTPSALFEAFFDLSLTGGMLCSPVCTAAGEVVDFALEQLNPAAQRLLGLAARPGRTLRAHFPAEVAPRLLDFLQAAYQNSDVRELTLPYPAANAAGFSRLAARRLGQQLVVSLLDEVARGPHEPAQPAPTELQPLSHILEQVPAAIAMLSGPEHRYTFASAGYYQLVGRSALVGQTVAEALPELADQGLIQFLNQVRTSGQPYIGQEKPVQLHNPSTGTRQQHYLNFVYQPLQTAPNQAPDILVFVVDVTEQVQARQQAEANARRLQLLTDSLPVLIGYLDLEERYQFANAAYRSWFNQEPHLLLGRPVREIVGEAAYQGIKTYIDRALAGEQLDFEARMPYREGFVKYIRTSYVPDVQAGELRGFYTLVTDITEQTLARQHVEQINQKLEAHVEERTQAAQHALREAERQRGELWRVFEQAPLAIAVYRGPNYIIELANPTVARLWGRSQEQLIGKGLFEALPEVAGMGYEELLDGVMATGVPYVAHAMEAQHDRNGRRETVYWDFVYVPMYEADGSIYGAMVVATEVTQQVLARREVEQLNQELETRVRERTRQLAEQQQLLRQILRQVPASIATLGGPEHRFTFFNEPYQQLSAARTGLGLTVAEVFPEVVAQGFVDLLDHVYATGEPFIGTDAPIQLLDATSSQPEQRYVDFTYQPLFDDQGRTLGILAFILDVTDKVWALQQVQHLNEELASINEELQATNEELHDSNARLLRTNADLDTFVYTASHDLKAPIANIEGLLDTLREYLPATDTEPMVPRLLEMMQGAVTRFQQTVGHLTDVSRLQQSQAQPAEALLLATVVEDVLLDLASLVEATHAQVRLDLAECPIVYFSSKGLRSILYNLLSNALKYHSLERHPLVHVRARCSETLIFLEVEDNGLGLSEQQQTKLFTLFRRLHNHVEGSGVGLFMIKRIIENAGGSVAVHSQAGVGSAFLVTLPRL